LAVWVVLTPYSTGHMTWRMGMTATGIVKAVKSELWSHPNSRTHNRRHGRRSVVKSGV